MDATSWRFVFVVAVPFAIAGAIAVMVVGKGAKDQARSTAKVDYAGGPLITLGLGAIVAGLILGPDRGFMTLYPMALGVAGVLMLIAFVVAEHRVANPLLPPDTFASRAEVADGWRLAAGGSRHGAFRSR